MKSQRVTLRLPVDLVERIERLAPRLAVEGVDVAVHVAYKLVLRLGIDAAEAKYPHDKESP